MFMKSTKDKFCLIYLLRKKENSDCFPDRTEYCNADLQDGGFGGEVLFLKQKKIFCCLAKTFFPSLLADNLSSSSKINARVLRARFPRMDRRDTSVNLPAD